MNLRFLFFVNFWTDGPEVERSKDEKIFTQAGGASLTPLQIKGYAGKGVTDA